MTVIRSDANGRAIFFARVYMSLHSPPPPLLRSHTPQLGRSRSAFGLTGCDVYKVTLHIFASRRFVRCEASRTRAFSRHVGKSTIATGVTPIRRTMEKRSIAGTSDDGMLKSLGIETKKSSNCARSLQGCQKPHACAPRLAVRCRFALRRRKSYSKVSQIGIELAARALNNRVASLCSEVHVACALASPHELCTAPLLRARRRDAAGGSASRTP